MIRIEIAPEIPSFDGLVRQPGQSVLEAFRSRGVSPPVPSVEWQGHELWQKVRDQIWAAYEGICCYTATFIDPASAYWGTVEHARPKGKYPELAYEWRNLRLASRVVNTVKKDYEDVIDPSEIRNGWFSIDEVTLEIEVGQSAPSERYSEVEQTIARLRLNRIELVTSRRRYLDKYLRSELTLDGLQMDAPFLAMEVKRWGLQPE